MAAFFSKIIAFFMMILSFFGLVSPEQPKEITYDAPEKVVVADDGTVDISFNANSTTGYTWTVDRSNDVFAQTDSKYVTDESAEGLVGAGGVQHFYFKASSPGETQIKFAYERPWENSVPISVVRCTLTADENMKVTVTWLE